MRNMLIQRLALLFIVLLSAACETTNVYPSTNKSFTYSIGPDQWTDHRYRIFHSLLVPELTDYYLKQGGIHVSISFNHEESYDILPATFDGVAYSVQYTKGKVTIFGEDPLLDPNIYVPKPTQTVKIKIVLTDSEHV